MTSFDTFTRERQVDPTSPAYREVRDLLDIVVGRAAPRLGSVATARIAKPLTDAVVALRNESLAQNDGWHQVAAALGASDPTDPASAMAALQERTQLGPVELPTVEQVAEEYRRRYDYSPEVGTALDHCRDQAVRMLDIVRAAAAAEAGPAPVERDELIETPERLAQVPDTALIRDADSITFEKAGPLDDDTDVWAMPGGEGRFRPSLPVRVLDLGIGGSK